MNEILYEILGCWAPDADTGARRIGVKIGRTLDAFTRIDPLLARWMTCDAADTRRMAYDATDVPAKLTVVDAMTADLTAIVEAGAWIDDFGEPDPEAYGYRWYSTTGDPAGQGSPRAATFTCAAGAKFRNYFTFEIGSPFDPPDFSIVTYPLFKKVILAILPIWPAAWACARCSSWGQDPAEATGDPTFPCSQYQMPWIGYLSAERAAQVVVSPGILTERTPDGGLLMTAAEALLDPSNPQHMARSKVIAGIMIEHGGNPGY